MGNTQSTESTIPAPPFAPRTRTVARSEDVRAFDVSREMFGGKDVVDIAEFVILWLAYEARTGLDRRAFMDANRGRARLVEDVLALASAEGVTLSKDGVEAARRKFDVCRIEGRTEDAILGCIAEGKMPLLVFQPASGIERVGAVCGYRPDKGIRFVDFPQMIVKSLKPSRARRVLSIFAMDDGGPGESAFIADSEDDDSV